MCVTNLKTFVGDDACIVPRNLTMLQTTKLQDSLPKTVGRGHLTPPQPCYIAHAKFVMCKQITCRGRHPSSRMDIYVMAYKTRVRNGQDRSLQSILLCAINNKTIRRAGCPHPAAKKPCLLRQMPQIICKGRCLHRPAEPCRTANFCTKIPDSKPIPRKTKGMRTLVSTENSHAYS